MSYLIKEENDKLKKENKKLLKQLNYHKEGTAYKILLNQYEESIIAYNILNNQYKRDIQDNKDTDMLRNMKNEIQKLKKEYNELMEEYKGYKRNYILSEGKIGKMQYMRVCAELNMQVEENKKLEAEIMKIKKMEKETYNNMSKIINRETRRVEKLVKYIKHMDNYQPTECNICMDKIANKKLYCGCTMNYCDDCYKKLSFECCACKESIENFNTCTLIM